MQQLTNESEIQNYEQYLLILKFLSGVLMERQMKSRSKNATVILNNLCFVSLAGLHLKLDFNIIVLIMLC